MPLRPLLAYTQDSSDARALARDGGSAFVSPSLRAYLLAALADSEAVRGRPVLVVAGDDRSARDLAGDLRAWLAPRPVRLYPSRGVTYESHLTPAPHLVGLRVGALDSLLAPGGPDEPPVVVASAVALSEKVPDPALRPRGLVLRRGDLIDLDELTANLVAAGYERADQVTERGQFALRGGLLDLYPATEERAVRVDLFGDEVESLRWFSTFTQRSLGEAERVEVAPAAELAAEHRELAEIAALEETTRDQGAERPDIAELLPVGDFRALLDLIGADAALMVASEDDVEPALADHWQDLTAAFHDSDAHHLYVRPEQIAGELEVRARVRLSTVPRDQPVAFHAQAAGGAARSLREAEPELERLVRSGYRTVVAWPRRGEGERAAYNLARMSAAWASEHASPDPGLRFARATLREGFVAAPFRLAVLPEHRLLRRRRAQAPERPRSAVLRSFADLRTGDFVVHEDHGVARFGGFDTKTVAGVTRDYLQLEYAGQDRVFVPSEQLAKISRYVGAGGAEPTLSRLGGTRWDQIKARARRAAQELAGELLNLYAERRRRTGHPFPPDSDWQREFESRFAFQETADQQRRSRTVKADMEAARPMDRLICGDVGYGKTEVALRAAFKAARGRQAGGGAGAHHGPGPAALRNLLRAAGGLPGRGRALSRFRPASRAASRGQGLAAGRGRHPHRHPPAAVRATSVQGPGPADHRRGAALRRQAEGAAQAAQARVDVLTLSATPIPRTLHMALSGVRDMSIIETPPEGRLPIRTYVGEYDEELVREAIVREIDRGGQVFFVHNRVETIDETAERLRGAVPEARFVVAHGQMAEGDAGEGMLDFLRGEADVLVCTTIIETGLDIPQRQHADRRTAPTRLRPGAAVPAARARRPQRASAPTPTCCTPRRRR